MSARIIRLMGLIGTLVLIHSANGQMLEGSGGLKTGGLRLGTLDARSAQAGALPLTLPDVRPTQHPSAEYQGTMYKKAIYEKALRDRYRILRCLKGIDQ